MPCLKMTTGYKRLATEVLAITMEFGFKLDASIVARRVAENCTGDTRSGARRQLPDTGDAARHCARQGDEAVRRRDRKKASDDFRRGLFAMRDIVESGPVRVVNWRMIRLFAGIACASWGFTIAAILTPGWGAIGDDIWLFALGMLLRWRRLRFGILIG
jgi:hypothetical protein